MNAAPALRETFRIELEHPALPGHFPNRPVVPGVVLLDRVAAALERQRAGTLARLGAVKFLAPLLPGQDAQLFVERSDARVVFHIERAGQVILRGDGVLA